MIGAEMNGWRIGTIAAVLDGDDLAAAALFHNYQPRHGTIEISAAGRGRWVSRGLIADLAQYAFGEMKAQAVVARIADKGPARALAALGFKRYDIPRLRGRDAGEAVMVLADDDFTFCKGVGYGRKCTSAN